MKLIDSNILIYAAQHEHASLKDMFEKEEIAVSEISRLEVLGFHKLTAEAHTFFIALFSLVKQIPIDRSVIDKAITIRQTKNLKIGDAIIAATAFVNGFELVTRNIKDFKHITELKLNNPIDK